jgi:uncharacterized protein
MVYPRQALPRLRPLWVGLGAMAIAAVPVVLPVDHPSQGVAPWLAPAQAQASYPQRQHAIINDYGDVLSPLEQEHLQELLTQLRTNRDIEAVVVTIPAMATYGTGDRSFEQFATNLFNTWGIGDAQRHDGVLVLFSEGDRTVRIELGQGYSRAYDARMEFVIDEYMLPQFRDGHYSRGLILGTEAMINQLTGPPPSRLENLPLPSISHLQWPSANTLKDGAFFLLAGGAGGYSLLKRRNFLRPKCSSCQTVRLQSLPPQAAKTHLDAGQALELDLGAVQHNVLECPQCRQIVKRHLPGSHRFSRCPSCNYKTLETERQTTTVHPTYSSSGQARAERYCHHCHYRDETTISLPRLQHQSSRSSRAGGSSSGGGRSSGGGASGRW